MRRGGGASYTCVDKCRRCPTLLPFTTTHTYELATSHNLSEYNYNTAEIKKTGEKKSERTVSPAATKTYFFFRVLS